MTSPSTFDQFAEYARPFGLAEARRHGAVTLTDEQELDRLATLSDFEYARIRKESAERLSVRTKDLDAERKRRREAGALLGPTGQGKVLRLPEIEPAADPINGPTLLDQLTRTLQQYVILPRFGGVAIALWVIRAHADATFDTSPRLVLSSPEKRCGKTTLLELLAKLVPRPLPTSNASPAVLYRAIEASQPTLLIDELDSFKDANEELRGILNSGHRRETARVLRTVGDDHEPRTFSTWCPMVLAAIGRLPSTIEDRSIVIPMRRRALGEQVQRIRWGGRAGRAISTQLTVQARACARWAYDHRPQLEDAEPAVPDTLNDRAADNWRPLLAIAEAIGGDWADQARQAALELSGQPAQDTESIGVQLLTDLRGLFEKRDGSPVGSQEACDLLAEMEERPWGDWKHGKALSPHQLARLLKPYGVGSRNLRLGDKAGIKGYAVEDFSDAFSRYLPDFTIPIRYTATTSHQSGDSPLFQSATPQACSVSKNTPNPAPDAGCSAVAVQNQESGDVDTFFEEGHVD